jgi:hypothetical protein
LKLIDFNLDFVSSTNGHEFYANLSAQKTHPEEISKYQDDRPALLHRINNECADNSEAYFSRVPA